MGYFRADWPLIGLLLGLIGLSTLLGLMTAWPMAVLVDSVMTPAPRNDLIHRLMLAPLPSHRLGQVIGLAVLAMLIKLSQDLIGTGRTIVTNHINFRGLRRIRCDLYRKLQTLHLGYHRSQPQGDAIYRLTTDTQGFLAILSTLLMTFVALFTLATILSTLLSRHVGLTLVALAIMPPLVAANMWFSRRLRRRSLEAKAAESEYTTEVQRSMSCVGLVQAFGRQRDEFARFDSTVERNIRAWWRLSWQEMFYWLTVGTVFGTGAAVVFGYGGYLVWRDQFAQPRPNGMTVGDLMIFVSYLGLLWEPMSKITGFVATIQIGMAGVQRVFEVQDREVTVRDEPGVIRLACQPRMLALEGVSFGYQDDRPILRGIDVQIAPGQMVAFVGPSGVGKSTLLNLLPRFYDPTGGRVTLDGHDLSSIRLSDLRRHFAIVLQDNMMLPTTIAENIAYGRPEATDEQIREAARLAGAAGFIGELPAGYATRVAEGGQNLSGGQRQRIAIARALLTGSPILILDEPTSALDPHHEQLIIEVLRRLKGRRTIILISHRPSTVSDCDQIFVMSDGRIAERGTHEELMLREGAYSLMAERQFRRDEQITELHAAHSKRVDPLGTPPHL